MVLRKGEAGTVGELHEMEMRTASRMNDQTLAVCLAANAYNSDIIELFSY